MIFQKGCAVRRDARRWLHIAGHSSRGRLGLARRPLDAVADGDVVIVVVVIVVCGGTSAGGGVTVGYASHSCRGRRTETNRRRRVARFLATVRPALPFPFPSPAVSLFILRPPSPLSLSFSPPPFLSFPFLFILPSCLSPPTTTATAMACLAYSRRGEITSSCRSSYTFQGVPRVRRGTLPSISIPQRGTRALRLIILLWDRRRQSN